MTIIDVDAPETTALGTLSADEREALTDLEIVIGNGMEHFMQVGSALAEIRDERLYRESHKSFAEYVSVRWPRIGSRRNADRLIQHFEIEKSIKDAAPELTTGTARVARELASVPPPQRVEVLREAQTVAKAAGREEPTHRDVQSVVERRGLPAALPSSLPSSLPGALPSSLPRGLPSALPSSLPSSLPTALPTASQGEIDELRRAIVLAALMRSATEEAEARLAALRRRYPALQAVALVLDSEQITNSVTPLLNNPGLNTTIGFLALHAVEQ